MSIHAIINVLDLREHHVLLWSKLQLSRLAILIILGHVKLLEINVNQILILDAVVFKTCWLKFELLKGLDLVFGYLFIALNEHLGVHFR